MATFTGTSGVDNLIGGDTDDELFGLAGDDLLNGGAGSDTLHGGLGDDTLDGGGGFDYAEYQDASGAVTVNLVTGIVTGADGNDTLRNITAIHGGAFDDILIGDAGDNFIRGRLGDDRLDGGAGFDYVDYRGAGGAVTVNLATGASSGADGNDVLSNFEAVRGGNFADVISGSSRDENLRGGLGDDTIDGGAGFDFVEYSQATGSVIVDLAAGTSSGADGNDVLSNFEGVRGSHFADILTGNASDHFLRGNRGDDTLIGGSGFGFADYREATGSVTVNLATGTSSGADGNDILTGMKGIRGGSFADLLIGDQYVNVFRGGLGDDTIDGGAGVDYVDYAEANSSVAVNLATGVATGAQGNDVLISIEAIRGGGFADTLTGDAGDNFIRGGLGNDTIDGGAGFDYAEYTLASAAVVVNLATGTAAGAEGDDVLINVEAVRGGSFADTLSGDANANALRGGLGDDTLDGGARTDTAVVGSTRSASVVTYDSATGSYSVSGADGNDTLINIEFLAFTDGPVGIETAAGLSGVIHRLYNLETGQHFLTASNEEADFVRSTFGNFDHEGLSFRTASSNTSAATDVYRFSNNVTGGHFYTASVEERDAILATLLSYSFEGIAFRGYGSDLGPQEELYRFYNSSIGSHFFTTSEAERDAIIGTLPTFAYEGIAFYVDPL